MALSIVRRMYRGKIFICNQFEWRNLIDLNLNGFVFSSVRTKNWKKSRQEVTLLNESIPPHNLNGHSIIQMLAHTHLRTGWFRFQIENVSNDVIFPVSNWIKWILIFVCSTALCVVNPDNLGQFGIYNLTIDSDGCTFHTHQAPVNRILCTYQSNHI